MADDSVFEVLIRVGFPVEAGCAHVQRGARLVST